MSLADNHFVCRYDMLLYLMRNSYSYRLSMAVMSVTDTLPAMEHTVEKSDQRQAAKATNLLYE